MASYKRIRSAGAIALGACCALGTLITLFWHVRSPADLTTNHILIGLALVCALGAGHYFWQALRQFQLFSALGFGVLFLAGTAVCAVISAGRGAETIAKGQAYALHEDAKRLNHEREIAEARVERDRTNAAQEKAHANAGFMAEEAAVECKSGKRIRCEGATFASDQVKAGATDAMKRYQGADARYWQLVVQLDQFKPIVPPNIELKNASKLWAILTSYDEAQSLAALELLWPFLLSFLTELGTIVFLHYGVNHRPTNRAPKPSEAEKPSIPQERFFPQREPFANLRVNNPLAMRRRDAEIDLVAFISINGHVPSQEFLRERWGVRSKGTVSIWLKEWERHGLITRQQDGRVKITSAARQKTR